MEKCYMSMHRRYINSTFHLLHISIISLGEKCAYFLVYTRSTQIERKREKESQLISMSFLKEQKSRILWNDEYEKRRTQKLSYFKVQRLFLIWVYFAIPYRPITHLWPNIWWCARFTRGMVACFTFWFN